MTEFVHAICCISQMTSKLWKAVSIDICPTSGFYNATAMCKSCGTKPLADYLRSQRYAVYGAALATDLKCQIDSLVSASLAGSHAGTWVHPRVAIDLARWLCPEFAVRMDAWFIEELSRGLLAACPSVEAPTRRTYGHQMQLLNETDLHYRVVAYIRRFHTRAIFLAGLGELQDTEAKRLDAWAKGYMKGQPDLLILNPTRKHSGLALEFKSPAAQQAVAAPHQTESLKSLQSLGLSTLVSNDYDVICRSLDAHMASETYRCACCSGYFASERMIEAHLLRKRLREVDETDE